MYELVHIELLSDNVRLRIVFGASCVFGFMIKLVNHTEELFCALQFFVVLIGYPFYQYPQKSAKRERKSRSYKKQKALILLLFRSCIPGSLRPRHYDLTYKKVQKIYFVHNKTTDQIIENIISFVMPPSMQIFSPVIKPALSEQRKRTAFATPNGSPTRLADSFLSLRDTAVINGVFNFFYI